MLNFQRGILISIATFIIKNELVNSEFHNNKTISVVS